MNSINKKNSSRAGTGRYDQSWGSSFLRVLCKQGRWYAKKQNITRLSSRMMATGNVITMYNDFKGNFKDFAMVVPVPVVLKKDWYQSGQPGDI